MNQTLLDEVTARLKPTVSMPNLTFGFVIDEVDTYTIVIANGRPEITAVAFLPPTCTVKVYMSGAVLSDIVSGRVDPAVAYFTRKLRIAGPLSAARKLADLFQ